MKRINLELLLAASLLAAPVRAQQQTSAFEIRAVVTPHTIIDNQMLGNCISLASAVLNDLGDFAFVADCGIKAYFHFLNESL